MKHRPQKGQKVWNNGRTEARIDPKYGLLNVIVPAPHTADQSQAYRTLHHLGQKNNLCCLVTIFNGNRTIAQPPSRIGRREKKNGQQFLIVCRRRLLRNFTSASRKTRAIEKRQTQRQRAPAFLCMTSAMDIQLKTETVTAIKRIAFRHRFISFAQTGERRKFHVSHLSDTSRKCMHFPAVFLLPSSPSFRIFWRPRLSDDSP